MKKHFFFSKGFSLVELLISLGLFSVISAMVISALYSAFRVGKKSEALLMVKENGTNALIQMERQIRFAQSLDSPSSCPSVSQNTLSITSSLDQGQTTFFCPAGLAQGITSNSALLIDTTVVKVKQNSCSFVCSQASVTTPPTVTIQFELSAKNTGGLAENEVTLPFRTSVTLRNSANQ
jgi:prepilin-type N-terminal cleavage/methylation domain-containing protein